MFQPSLNNPRKKSEGLLHISGYLPMNNMLGQPIDINSKLFNELSELEKKEIIFNHFYFMREVCQFLKFLDDNGAPDEVIDYMNVLGTYAQQDSKYIHRVSRYITS